MMSTVKASKNNSGKASSSDRNDDNAMEMPITEEELREKETAITVNDVLRLAKPTKGETRLHTSLLFNTIFSRVFN